MDDTALGRLPNIAGDPRLHRPPYGLVRRSWCWTLRKRGHQPGGRQPLAPRAALGAGCQVEAQEQQSGCWLNIAPAVLADSLVPY